MSVDWRGTPSIIKAIHRAKRYDRHAQSHLSALALANKKTRPNLEGLGRVFKVTFHWWAVTLLGYPAIINERLTAGILLCFHQATRASTQGTIDKTPDSPGRQYLRRQYLLAVAKGASISQQESLNVIERIRSAADRWPWFVEQAGLFKARTDELDLSLNGRRPQPAQALHRHIFRRPGCSEPLPTRK